MIKKILAAAVTILLILLVAAIFVRKNYVAQASVVIKRPVHDVFDYVKYLKNQNEYSKWGKMDPLVRYTYTGVDGTVGFVSAWDSEMDELGKGEQEIKLIVEDEKIGYELRFFQPFETKLVTYLTTQALSGNSTLITWGCEGHIQYPTNLMLLFADLEDGLQGDFQEGLNNLKELLEKPPIPTLYTTN